MEFLRFGSSIPGSYWGCCAVCIIQNFKVDPDAKASIQMVSGDGGGAIGDTFAGPTYRDIFWQRLRTGTFSTGDMPNHTFFAILTQQQVSGGVGAKWLAILKEAGFEFIRTVDNSVYTGPTLKNSTEKSSHPNHIFGLFRNIGQGAIADPFTPPKEWTALPQIKPEAWLSLSDSNSEGISKTELLKEQQAVDLAIWNKIGPAKFLTRKQIEAAGAPVILAGLRSENKQEPATEREARQNKAGKKAQTSMVGVIDSPACPVPA